MNLTDKHYRYIANDIYFELLEEKYDTSDIYQNIEILINPKLEKYNIEPDEKPIVVSKIKNMIDNEVDISVLKKSYNILQRELNNEKARSEITNIIDTYQSKISKNENVLQVAKDFKRNIDDIIKKNTILDIEPYNMDDYKKDCELSPEIIKSKILSSSDHNVYYRPASLSFIAGRPSHGKTRLMMNEAINISLTGKKVAFITLEEQRKDIFTKLLKSYAYKKNAHIYGVDLSEKELSENFHATKRKHASFFNMVGNELHRNVLLYKPFPNIEEITELIKTITIEKGVKIFFIDYAQCIYFNHNSEYMRLSRHEQLKYINTLLLELSINEDIYLIIGSQFNRQVNCVEDIENTTKYGEAGTIETTGKLLINLWKEKEETYIYIAKNRDGRKDFGFTVDTIGSWWHVTDNSRSGKPQKNTTEILNNFGKGKKK